MRSALFFLFLPTFWAGGQSAAPGASKAVGELAHDAVTAQQHGDWKTAIDDYRKALALRPGDADLRLALAGALSAAGQFNAAIAEDNRVLQAHPGDVAAQIGVATAYFRMGDVSRAQMQFEAIHAAHPEDVNGAIGLAYVYIKTQRFADAANLLTPLDAAQSENQNFQYVYAYAQILNGNAAAGVARMEKVARARRSADAWMIAASTEFEKRDFHRAEEDAEQAIALNAALPGAQTLAGEARYALGDVDKATAEFQAALRQDPRDFTANLYLGIIRSNQRDFATARPLLELAVELVPTHPLARLELAKLNALTGREDEAVKELETLEKETPAWIEPHAQLATLYYRVHRPADGARERAIVERLQAEQQKAGPR